MATTKTPRKSDGITTKTNARAAKSKLDKIPKSNTTSSKAERAQQRPTGKLGLIIDRLATAKGATVAELAQQLGWQKHTVHGALSRLRSRGFAMQRFTEDDCSPYRLSSDQG